MMNTSSNLAVAITAPSPLQRLLGVLAPVRRSELVTVVTLTANVFVLLTCYYVLKVVREPLILLGGGAELKAYASAGQTLLLLAVVPGFGWLSSRVSRMRLLTTVQLIFAACLIAFYALARARAPIGLAFYLWLGIFNMLVISNFWSFANDLYTEEQGKRLFAIIGVGGSVGAIIGAFVPQVLQRVIGMHALMLVAAGGLALSIVLYRLAERSHRVDARRRDVPGAAWPSSASRAGQGEPVTSRTSGFALVMKDRYLRLVAGMLLVATIINTTGEYVVGKMATERSKAYAVERAPDREAPRAPAAGSGPSHGTRTASDSPQGRYIEKFYSDYYSLVNLLAFVLQAVVVVRVLTWLGVRRALFIMPAVALGGWIALGVFVNLTMVRIEKTAENSLDYSLHNTLRQALFLPTSRDSKYKAKAAIDTFFFRLGDVIAGLGIVFLLVDVLGLGVRTFAVLNVSLALCWIVLAARAGRLHDRLVADKRQPAAPAGGGAS